MPVQMENIHCPRHLWLLESLRSLTHITLEEFTFKNKNKNIKCLPTQIFLFIAAFYSLNHGNTGLVSIEVAVQSLPVGVIQ